MMPAERKKLNEERAKLKVYRNQLMQLGDSVPNMQELMEDNTKIIEYFEGGKVKKIAVPIKTVKLADKPKKEKPEPPLTVEKYKELKEKGLKDAAIMSEFNMTINQMSYWKAKNDLVGTKNPGGRGPKKSVKEKSEVGMSETTGTGVTEEVINYQGELNAALQKIKELESELSRKSLSSQDQIERNSQLMDQFTKAQKSEREAIEKLIEFQDEYRKLEVDYRNQSTELDRFKKMLERLKHTEQINVWLMKQHIGFVEQADDRAEAFSS